MTNPTSVARPVLARAIRMIALLLALTAGLMLWAQLGGRGAVAERLSSTRSHELPLLVNAEHPLPPHFATPKLASLSGSVPVANREVRVAAQIEAPLVSLFDAARAAGFDKLYVASGYRTAKEQQQLWNASSDHSYVQKPGHSEHQTGLAVDLADLKAGAKGLARSPAGHWLADNSYRYGFLLRYPPEKKAVTGIAYEPWHFRYVGGDIARQCHDRGWVLEEYVAAH